MYAELASLLLLISEKTQNNFKLFEPTQTVHHNLHLSTDYLMTR